MKVERASAKAGPVGFELTLETRDAADARHAEEPRRLAGGPAADAAEDAFVAFLRAFEERLQRLRLTARGVPLDDRICGKLPGETARKMKQMFQPDRRGGRDLRVRPRAGRVAAGVRVPAEEPRRGVREVPLPRRRRPRLGPADGHARRAGRHPHQAVRHRRRPADHHRRAACTATATTRPSTSASPGRTSPSTTPCSPPCRASTRTSSASSAPAAAATSWPRSGSSPASTCWRTPSPSTCGTPR